MSRAKAQKAFTVTLKQLIKQIPGAYNDSALKHKHNFKNIQL